MSSHTRDPWRVGTCTSSHGGFFPQRPTPIRLRRFEGRCLSRYLRTRSARPSVLVAQAVAIRSNNRPPQDLRVLRNRNSMEHVPECRAFAASRLDRREQRVQKRTRNYSSGSKSGRRLAHLLPVLGSELCVVVSLARLETDLRQTIVG